VCPPIRRQDAWTRRVATVAAYGIDSGGLVSRHDASWRQRVALLRRQPGLPSDIAPLALYLASDESTWVTGQNYSIDGGVTASFR
jgi:NAD(P)-dependent dehydrogenase (short-subunit alcohol dehydrogenase family)